jgi:hypothetical protein
MLSAVRLGKWAILSLKRADKSPVQLGGFLGMLWVLLGGWVGGGGRLFCLGSILGFSWMVEDLVQASKHKTKFVDVWV